MTFFCQNWWGSDSVKHPQSGLRDLCLPVLSTTLSQGIVCLWWEIVSESYCSPSTVPGVGHILVQIQRQSSIPGGLYIVLEECQQGGTRFRSVLLLCTLASPSQATVWQLVANSDANSVCLVDGNYCPMGFCKVVCNLAGNVPWKISLLQSSIQEALMIIMLTKTTKIMIIMKMIMMIMMIMIYLCVCVKCYIKIPPILNYVILQWYQQDNNKI